MLVPVGVADPGVKKKESEEGSPSRKRLVAIDLTVQLGVSEDLVVEPKPLAFFLHAAHDDTLSPIRVTVLFFRSGGQLVDGVGKFDQVAEFGGPLLGPVLTPCFDGRP